MILITGAAGKTGLSIIRGLRGKGESIRAFVRDDEQEQRVRAAGANDVFIGDLEETDDLIQAIHAVRAVYHVCPNMHYAETQIGRELIDICTAQADVRFVYHSVFHPQIEEMPHHWSKMRVEEMLIGSGLDYVILQPTAYMQNVLQKLTEVTEEGVFRNPYRVETRTSMVDLADVAECAVKALIGTELLGGTFELVGPDDYSQVEIAALLSRALGIPVRAEEIPLENWFTQARNSSLNRYAVVSLYKMFEYYNNNNFRGNSKVLETILGRPATSFETFLKRELSALRVR